MSVLETFLILFESDAEEAKKDIKGLNNELDNTEESAKGVTEISDKLGKSIEKSAKDALKATVAYFALKKIYSGFMDSISEIDALNKFSDRINENIEDVSAWSYAITSAGGDVEAFKNTLESLNEKLVDASLKGFNEVVPFFNQLGISIVDTNGKMKSTIELLPELADSFARIDKQQAAGIGKKLGLDIGTIMLLQQGRKEVEALVKRQRELGVINKESGEITAKFKKEYNDLQQALNFSTQNLIVSVVPAITSLLDVITDVVDWMNKNQTVVEGFFIAISSVVFAFAIPAFTSLAISVWAAIGPFVAIGAVIVGVAAAFALLYEDVIAFMNGQDSLIGKISEKWPIVGIIVKALVNEVRGFFRILSALAGFLFDLFTRPITALQKLKDMVGDVSEFLGFGDSEAIVNAQKSINFASTSPIAAQTSASIQNITSQSARNTSVQTGDVIVNTQATDANGIAADISGSLNQQFRSTVDNFDDGVKI